MSKPDVVTRFLSKVDIPGDDECWRWTAGTDEQGYGVFSIDRHTRVKAHRFSYEFNVGPIPEGLVIDHLCRNTGCVNPTHLEPVSRGENVRRGDLVNKDTCRNGLHPWPESATTGRKDGRRICFPCEKEANRKSQVKRTAKNRERRNQP